MTENNRGREFAGIFLIVLGLVLFVIQFVRGWGDSLFLILVGSLFIAGYLYRRAYGLLIPGCLLLGLGFGQIVERSFAPMGDWGAIGLGAGFASIYLADLVYRRSSHWWPLIPGLVLILVGISQGNPALQNMMSIGWPLILIFIGALMLAGALGLVGRRSG